jgi:ribosome biogenesis GTPase A
MQIQWYPGHMYKANKEFKKILPQIDVIIEILDARIPYSSENPMVAELRGNKPCIKVLNKSDLADVALTEIWKQYWDKQLAIKALVVNRDEPQKIEGLVALCKKLIPKKRGGDIAINAMIMGIPNVGKSTLINSLAGRGIAKTGNEPAVTKRQQRIDLKNGVVLLDTPGVLWPNIENPHSGYRLAATGAIKDTAIDYDDVAFYLAEVLLEKYPQRLAERYQLADLPETEYELMQSIGAKRGCLRAGGEVHLEKVSKILVSEYRAGMLGAITLETPEMMEHEKYTVSIVRAEKAAKKEARLKRRGKKSR